MTADEIIAQAEDYAKSYNEPSVAPFPHQLVLANKRDLEIVHADLEDDSLAGAILYKDDKFTILINVAKSARVQNVTLGHELGHYALHAPLVKERKAILDNDDFVKWAAVSFLPEDRQAFRTEVEANLFALHLLMPADLVKRGWEVTRNVQELAKIFKVTTVAMSQRLTEMGLVK